MKNIQFILAFLISMSGMLYLASCTNADPTFPSPAVIENNVQSGSWRITSFIDSGKDETSHFIGYTFIFGNNGVLTATNGNVTHTGTWSITDGNSADDSPNDLDFNILFNLTNAFEDLNEDWHFLSQSSNRVELIHVSGGNGGTDYLTFEKV
jgi:hypothetical protein